MNNFSHYIGRDHNGLLAVFQKLSVSPRLSMGFLVQKPLLYYAVLKLTGNIIKEFLEIFILIASCASRWKPRD